MQKLKLIAVLFVFVLVGTVLSGSSSFSTTAKIDNTLQEIAGYKSWTKITKKPIKVSESFVIDGRSGSE